MLGLVLFLVQSVSAAPELVALPNGLKTYQDNFVVHRIRHTEIVDHQTVDGQKRVKFLRKDGYNCLRNKPKTTKCWFDKFPETILPEVAPSIEQAIGDLSIEFPMEYKNIEFSHDGSTTQEWIANDPYKVNGRIYSHFTIVRNDEDKWFFSFPIEEGLAFGYLNYHSTTRLGLSMVANSKYENRIVSYFIEAYLE